MYCSINNMVISCILLAIKFFFSKVSVGAFETDAKIVQRNFTKSIKLKLRIRKNTWESSDRESCSLSSHVPLPLHIYTGACDKSNLITLNARNVFPFQRRWVGKTSKNFIIQSLKALVVKCVRSIEAIEKNKNKPQCIETFRSKQLNIETA